jgi:hypothetical protein
MEKILRKMKNAEAQGCARRDSDDLEAERLRKDHHSMAFQMISGKLLTQQEKTVVTGIMAERG